MYQYKLNVLSIQQKVGRSHTQTFVETKYPIAVYLCVQCFYVL